MRWKNETFNYKAGDRKVVERVLFFPKCLNEEYRWLEKTKIVQVLIEQDTVRIGNNVYGINPKRVWKDLCWADITAAKFNELYVKSN